MPNLNGSNQVRFSPVQGSVGDHVLNHPTASPFKKHNISFHIQGNYLTDFSKQGIKDFVGEHNSKLAYQEVGTFLQSVAANAPQVAGATFNLEDPELGLFKKDGINEQHIRTGFQLDTKSGTLPSQGVVFFDATKALHPLKEAEVAIENAEKKVKGAEKAFGKAEDKVEDAQYYRQRLVDFLGKDSPRELAEKQGKVSSLTGRLQELGTEKTQYSDELKRLEADHNNQVATPGMNQEQRWLRITELKRALRGLEAETKDSSKELDKTKESISAKQGPLSFMGIGNSLSELHGRNQDLKKAQDGLQSARQTLDSARQELDSAKALRERILKGESLWPTAPTAPTPAPAEPTPAPVVQEPVAPAPAQPAEPVTPSQPEEPITPSPAQPAAPQPAPVAEQPVTPPPPAPVAEQPVADPPPTPAQPAPQQPSQPASGEYVPFEPIIPGNQYNPIVSDKPVWSEPAPVAPQPAAPQPAPVVQPAQPTAPPVVEEPVAPQPAPVQPAQPTAPVSQPSAPVAIGEGSVSKILYTVKRGDTLSSIAQNQLGSWRRWGEIAEMNRQVIGSSNNHWIYPGQVLTLPPLNVKPRPTS